MPTPRVSFLRCERGFALVEVLVAVAVLGLVLTGLFRGLKQHSANTAALADRTFAHWVTLNAVEELRLQPFDGRSAVPRITRRTEHLGGVAWTLVLRRESGPDGLTRVVAAASADGRPGALLVGFVPSAPVP